MSTLRLPFLLVVVLALVPAVASGFSPGAGLSGTPHDFVSGSSIVTADVGLCTFCHTPHKGNTTVGLLWNHTLSANNFNWGASATTAGGTPYATINGSTYTGPTAKCLSCHDGTVAIGSVNWYQETANNVIDSTKITDPEFLISTATGDLSGNHPVAMPYPFNQQTSTYNTKTIGATGTLAVLTEFVADPTNGGAGTNGTNIRLFTDASGAVRPGTAVGSTGIECSSCHDPHNKKAVDDLFLRGMIKGATAASGYICLQCHIK